MRHIKLILQYDGTNYAGWQSQTRTTLRKLESVLFDSMGDCFADARNDMVSITFKGNGFLKYMIRNIVGTLVEVGCGKREVKEMESILLARNRSKAGPTAPAEGLHLIKIEY